MGREAAAPLLDSMGLKVRRADAVGERVYIEGNSAAGLGAVYGGATVCAWYPITPSTSLAEAFTAYCEDYRTDPESGEARYATSSRPRMRSPPSASSWAPAGTARGPSPAPPGQGFP